MQYIIGGIVVWNSFARLKNISRLNAWKSVGGKVVERGTFRITYANKRVRNAAGSGGYCSVAHQRS